MSPSNPMRLVNVYREPTAVQVLYALLQDRPREAGISHKRMPTYEQHQEFVRSHPYRMWFLIRVDGEFVGDLHVTNLNEIGIFLFEQQRGKGYGGLALKMFMLRHRPLHAIPAVRVPQWLARVAPSNIGAAEFFRKSGFNKIEETYAYG